MDTYLLLFRAEGLVWYRVRHASPHENRIRSRRQASGLSRQELACRCVMTRQAMNAVEAGRDVSSTLVAMCMLNRVAELAS